MISLLDPTTLTYLGLGAILGAVAIGFTKILVCWLLTKLFPSKFPEKGGFYDERND